MSQGSPRCGEIRVRFRPVLRWLVLCGLLAAAPGGYALAGPATDTLQSSQLTTLNSILSGQTGMSGRLDDLFFGVTGSTASIGSSTAYGLALANFADHNGQALLLQLAQTMGADWIDADLEGGFAPSGGYGLRYIRGPESESVAHELNKLRQLIGSNGDVDTSLATGRDTIYKRVGTISTNVAAASSTLSTISTKAGSIDTNTSLTASRVATANGLLADILTAVSSGGGGGGVDPRPNIDDASDRAHTDALDAQSQLGSLNDGMTTSIDNFTAWRGGGESPRSWNDLAAYLMEGDGSTPTESEGTFTAPDMHTLVDLRSDVFGSFNRSISEPYMLDTARAPGFEVTVPLSVVNGAFGAFVNLDDFHLSWNPADFYTPSVKDIVDPILMGFVWMAVAARIWEELRRYG